VFAVHGAVTIYVHTEVSVIKRASAALRVADRACERNATRPKGNPD